MNYLNQSKMKDFIRTASIRQISKIWIFACELIDYWGMHSLENVFSIIDSYIAEVNEFVDIDILKLRLNKLRETRTKNSPISDKPRAFDFLPLGFMSDIKVDIPELVTIRDEFQKAFMLLPSGIDKAEAWLYPFALKTATDGDLEALIYFKCKGESFVSSHNLSEAWRKSICIDVERSILTNDNDKNLIERAEKKKIPLVELADLFRQSILHPSILQARDEEADFISSTFFRAMEWFQLNEFDPWADVYAQEISTAYQDGIDHVYSLYQMFYYCRSDLLLRKVSKFGLEVLLSGLCVGSIDPLKPWRQRWEEVIEGQRSPSYIDHIPTASIIVFAWQRINPTNINSSILDESLLLLFQTQMVSGAWPLMSKDADGSIFSTCLAMTAISIIKPEGYQRYVDKAKEWLLKQQNEVGCWYIQGAPVIMINTLCLEAIRLAEGDRQVTYMVRDHSKDISHITSSLSKQTDQFIIFCEGNSSGKKKSNFDEKCYTKIFSLEYPDAVFISVGSCTDIEVEDKLLFDVIKKANPYHKIIKLIDRDDRSVEEIGELKTQDITVLSLRELESYLLEDEIIERLCISYDKLYKYSEIIEIKEEALSQSIERGNPCDDLKSAAGFFFTETKKVLRLTKCGNDTVTFLRDTMAPLITKDTNSLGRAWVAS